LRVTETKKTGNKYSSEIAWEWFVHPRARTLVQEHAKEVNLGHIMGDWEVSEIDIRFCLVYHRNMTNRCIKELVDTFHDDCPHWTDHNPCAPTTQTLLE
jgi:hypothetical protein